jgi:hypothetical protein
MVHRHYEMVRWNEELISYEQKTTKKVMNIISKGPPHNIPRHFVIGILSYVTLHQAFCRMPLSLDSTL